MTQRCIQPLRAAWEIHRSQVSRRTVSSRAYPADAAVDEPLHSSVEWMRGGVTVAQGPANKVLAGASSLAVFDDWTRVHCNHAAVRHVRPHPLGDVLMRVSSARPESNTLPGSSSVRKPVRLWLPQARSTPTECHEATLCSGRTAGRSRCLGRPVLRLNPSGRLTRSSTGQVLRPRMTSPAAWGL